MFTTADLSRGAIFGFVAVGVLGLTSAAMANDTTNLIQAEMMGSDNILYITQEHGPTRLLGAAPNSITAAIDGDRNGGHHAGWRGEGALARSNLMPGTLVQVGFDNSVSLTVTGNDNLFAMTQNGNGNKVQGTMFGTGNQAAVTQSGFGNRIVFSQTGQRNTIMVSQRSW